MLAVVEIWWNQFITKTWDIIDVKKINKEIWETLSVEAMLLSDEDWKDVKIWTPFVEGSIVELKVLEQFKDKKVRVFKMKSKKRYARNKWFRPSLTKLEVLNIG